MIDGYIQCMRISVAEAKNRLPEIIRAVENGEPVTICRRGIPVVDLVRTGDSSDEPPRFGTLKGRITINDPDWWKPMSEEEVEAFLDGKL